MQMQMQFELTSNQSKLGCSTDRENCKSAYGDFPIQTRFMPWRSLYSPRTAILKNFGKSNNAWHAAENPQCGTRGWRYVWDVAVVSENLLDSILSDHIQKSLAGREPTSNSPDVSEPNAILDDLAKRTGPLLPIFLDRIATLALGLSISQSSASTVAIQVTPPKVSEACQLLIKNWQARSDWTKAVMGDQQDEAEK